jgi:hypothetical protein
MFVTGVYGSGKTQFAKRYAIENQVAYISFDEIFDYTHAGNQSKAILATLPSEFVIDAIPFDMKHGWDDFIDYELSHPVAVVCVYCPDKREWLQRVREKRINRILFGYSGFKRPVVMHSVLARRLWLEVSRWPGGFLKRVWGFLKTWFSKVKHARIAVADIDEKMHLADYRRFFQGKLPAFREFKNVQYFDSVAETFTSEQEMLDRIGYKYFPFEAYLDSVSEEYDSRYQDIEIIDFIGYTQSYKTWDNIQDLVDWKQKRVVDLGCFHGYFAFKVEDRGSIAQGLDRSVDALRTARMINEFRGGDVIFREWEGGEEIPECDVILCLNVLHHFKDQRDVLSKMKADAVIFEVNQDHVPLIRQFFRIVKKVRSHRKARSILLCKQFQ